MSTTMKITPEMYEALKKPLPEGAVSKHPTKTYLSSIKAIYVTERLNEVFGCGAWQIRTEKVSENENGFVVIKTILTIPEYGVYYESYGGNDNGGEKSKNFDLGDAYKGATTDGITKIGSYLGIGMSVFKGHGNTPEPKKPAIKPDLLLTDKDKYEAVKKYVDDQLTAGKMPAYIIHQIKQRYTIPNETQIALNL